MVMGGRCDGGGMGGVMCIYIITVTCSLSGYIRTFCVKP